MHLPERRVFVKKFGKAALAIAGSTGLASAAEPTKPRIKIGQIGVGHAHASKLAVYRRSRDYEVVGIVEPDPALRRLAGVMANYKDLPWVTPEQLLKVPRLQAVLGETRGPDLLHTGET